MRVCYLGNDARGSRTLRRRSRRDGNSGRNRGKVRSVFIDCFFLSPFVPPRGVIRRRTAEAAVHAADVIELRVNKVTHKERNYHVITSRAFLSRLD